jgi:putative endonuclease
LYDVYILASRPNGTLYIGVSNNLLRRLDEHARGSADAFTRRCGVHTLVYYEEFQWINDAIAREKQLKRWNRAWKIRLIETTNPGWNDVAGSVPYSLA